MSHNLCSATFTHKNRQSGDFLIKTDNMSCEAFNLCCKYYFSILLDQKPERKAWVSVCLDTFYESTNYYISLHVIIFTLSMSLKLILFFYHFFLGI